ncbi:MAG: hypothetical protein HN337_08920 [Deltaproteobacteria bacterium]|jgi:hypothetical protein|nr:hypothetical protein [Deltaproteobacteria bacterium]
MVAGIDDGVYVAPFCGRFPDAESFGELPALINYPAQLMCSYAEEGGDFERLEPWEGQNAWADFIFNRFGGIQKFAQLMMKTKLDPQVDDKCSRWGQEVWPYNNAMHDLYEGFTDVKVSEPPFLAKGLIVDKIGEEVKTGAQILTIGIGDHAKVKVTLASPDAALLEGFGKIVNFSLQEMENILQRMSGAHVETSGLAHLPFMKAYHSGMDASFEEFLVQPESSESDTYIAGEIDIVGLGKTMLYLDSAGRFFYKAPYKGEEQRIYVDTPKSHPKSYHLRGNYAFDYDYSSDSRRYSGGGFCFTGDMKIDLEGDEFSSLESLYAIQESGEDLPAVKVWDPDKSEWTYQVPAKVMRHALTHNTNIFKISTDLDEKPLEVTGNHYIWIRRGGKEFWAQAINIVPGDELLLGKDEAGEKQWKKTIGVSFAKSDIMKDEGSTHLPVYNLAFGDDKLHNYAVSNDGIDWFVAHNKMY